ncbi:MAG: hypothetical protein WBC05_00475 [Sedimentisphaerales bacterium]
MKQVLFCAVLALFVETAFGHGGIVSSSTDGNGRFEYVVENLNNVVDLDDIVLLIAYDNAGIYLAEGPANWSANISASETVFVANDPIAYLTPGSQATFVLYSEYTHSTYQWHPGWGIDRFGNDIIIRNSLVLVPASEPDFGRQY